MRRQITPALGVQRACEPVQPVAHGRVLRQGASQFGLGAGEIRLALLLPALAAGA